MFDDFTKNKESKQEKKGGPSFFSAIYNEFFDVSLNRTRSGQELAQSKSAPSNPRVVIRELMVLVLVLGTLLLGRCFLHRF